jgi:glycosyltransferase involved in cell wall biosynthesis
MLISIVCPVFSEEGNLKNFYINLTHEILLLEKYKFEIIFIDDGSLDNSNKIIHDLIGSSKIPTRLITLSKNFGKEIALTAGLNYCSNSDAVITLDVDMQHPIDQIKNLIKHWEDGFDLVIGVRDQNIKLPFYRKISSSIYNLVMNALANYNFITNSTDFRLMGRKVVLAFNSYKERQRVFRHIVDSLGFKKKILKFIAQQRFSGLTKFNFYSLIKLMSLSIISYSLWPLKILLIFGFLITFFSLIFLFFMLFDLIILNSIYKFSPIAFLMIVNIFLSGLILTAIGIVALYVGSIQIEVIRRPLYIIKDTSNLEKNL